MKTALTREEKYVDASSANHYQNYRCPVCFAPVSLRSAGSTREAHFAHWPGYGNNSCDLFSGAKNHGQIYLPQPDCDSYESNELVLGLRLIESPEHYGWTLELLIPTQGIEHGDITVDVGGRFQTLKLRENKDNFRLLTADPQTNPYRIVSEDKEHKNNCESFRDCLGLSDTKVSVFGEIEKPGPRISNRARVIKSARGYALLWNTQHSYKIPDEFDYESLQIQGDWTGAFISIPQTISEEAKQWLQEVTGLPFKEIPNGFVPIWPPLIRHHSADCFETIEHTPVAIFARQTKSVLRNTLPNVFARSPKETIGAQAIAANEAYFYLTAKDAVSIEIGSKQLGDIKLDLSFTLRREDFTKYNTAFVELVGINKANEVTKIALHDREIINWLREVRNGKLTLLSIDAPLEIYGTLKVGRNGLWTPPEYVISTKNSSIRIVEISAERVSQINRIADVLKDKSKDVAISFNGFGQASIYATVELNAESSKAREKVLCKDLKLSMLSFLKQVPNQAIWPPFSKSINDTELIRLVVNTKPTHKTLAKHRTLLKQLKQIP